MGKQLANGYILRCVRQLSDLTLQKLAKKWGYATSYLYDVEMGKKEVRIESYKELVQSLDLGICVQTLLTLCLNYPEDYNQDYLKALASSAYNLDCGNKELAQKSLLSIKEQATIFKPSEVQSNFLQLAMVPLFKE